MLAMLMTARDHEYDHDEVKPTETDEYHNFNVQQPLVVLQSRRETQAEQYNGIAACEMLIVDVHAHNLTALGLTQGKCLLLGRRQHDIDVVLRGVTFWHLHAVPAQDCWWARTCETWAAECSGASYSTNAQNIARMTAATAATVGEKVL